MSAANDPVVVVVLTKPFPIPPDAGSPRPFQLITRLAARTRLHCVAGVRCGESEWNEFVESPSVASLFESVSTRHGRPQDPGSAQALIFLTGSPRHDLRFRDPVLLRETRSLTRRVAEAHSPVVFLCMGIEALQLVPRPLWHCCVVDGIDPWSLSLERQARDGAELPLVRRMKLYLAQFGMRRFERQMFERVSAVSYNSSDDIAYLRRHFPDAPIVRVIDGCDTDYFTPEAVADVDEQPDEILFNGHMRYGPNLDGACHLVDDIMPLVWKRRPRTRAWLVGPDPSGALARYAHEDRVVATGFVDDVRPYLKRASVVVSALRVGTGMKNKLQAGLAMEKAMVVSSVTAEGFDGLESGRHAVVTDDPAEFAGAVCDLLDDPARRARMGVEGRRLIRERFSWNAAIEALWGALEACPRTAP